MESANRISLKALKVWRINGMIQTVVFICIAGIITLLGYLFDWYMWISIAVWAAAAAHFIYQVFVGPALAYRQWRYRVGMTEIETKKGIFITTRTLIPMVRVQHVDLSQGPVMRKYNLASVEIYTAATVHEIPALEYEEAEELRNYISNMVQMVKEDV